jgi:hypothetical protein
MIKLAIISNPLTVPKKQNASKRLVTKTLAGVIELSSAEPTPNNNFVVCLKENIYNCKRN